MKGLTQTHSLFLSKESIMQATHICLLFILSSACTAKKIAVKNADLLLEHQIEKHLPLYSAQRKLLSHDVNEFLNEQKPFAKEAIPVITSMELDVNKVDEQYSYLHSLYVKLALNFSKLMSKYIAPLDQIQQKEFENSLKAENESLKYSKADDRLEKIEDRFESFFGTISDKQRKIIKEQKQYIEERHKIRLARRKELHKKFLEIYKLDLSEKSRADYFYEAFAEYQRSYPEGGKNIEILKKVIPTLSASQKEVFEDKTNDIKDILNYYLETHY